MVQSSLNIAGMQNLGFFSSFCFAKIHKRHAESPVLIPKAKCDEQEHNSHSKVGQHGMNQTEIWRFTTFKRQRKICQGQLTLYYLASRKKKNANERKILHSHINCSDGLIDKIFRFLFVLCCFFEGGVRQGCLALVFGAKKNFPLECWKMIFSHF